MNQPVSIDDPAVSGFLFHPRPEGSAPPGSALPTETRSEEAVVCGYLHANPGSETLMLFFHGNGEIAADYSALAHLYTNCGVSFWAVDYRGYGRSTGRPSFSRMLTDARSVLYDVPSAAEEAGISVSRVVVMGRSLGSAPALYLAAEFPDRVSALLLDSPFSDGPALIRRLGGPHVDSMSASGVADNRDRIRRCATATLIIHGTEDVIIPIAEAEALHRESPSPVKRLVKIRGAGHNDLMVQGYGTYFSEIRSLLNSTGSENR